MQKIGDKVNIAERAKAWGVTLVLGILANALWAVIKGSRWPFFQLTFHWFFQLLFFVAFAGIAVFAGIKLSRRNAAIRWEQFKVSHLIERAGTGIYLDHHTPQVTASSDCVALWKDVVCVWTQDTTAFLNSYFSTDLGAEFMDITGESKVQDIRFHAGAWEDLTFLNRRRKNLNAILRSLQKPISSASRSRLG